MQADGIPAPVQRWVTAVTGLPVSGIQRVSGGLSRMAFMLRLGTDADSSAFLMLQGSDTGNGNHHDAHVLTLLQDSAVRVPRVIAYSETLKALLLETLDGETDITHLHDPGERQSVSADLMLNLARLHQIDVRTLGSTQLSMPGSADECARQALAPLRDLCSTPNAMHDPLLVFGLSWLEDNCPLQVEHLALLHGDIGPGNFLFQQNRITGIVDWEMAHIGDPMEDIARIYIRCMSVPMGDLEALMRVYEQQTGRPLDRQRIAFYAVLTLLRSILLIRQSLANPLDHADAPQKYMYEALLMRAVVDTLQMALCQTPLPELGRQPVDPDPQDIALQLLTTEVENRVRPGIRDSWVLGRLDWILRLGRHAHHSGHVNETLQARAVIDARNLLGIPVADTPPIDTQVCQFILAAPPDKSLEIVSYLARRVQRECYRRRELLGPLYTNRISMIHDCK